jgi:hypothetical protein
VIFRGGVFGDSGWRRRRRQRGEREEVEELV